jgi:hypothetical protein
MALLDPNVVLRADIRTLGRGAPAEIRGAAAIADRARLGQLNLAVLD